MSAAKCKCGNSLGSSELLQAIGKCPDCIIAEGDTSMWYYCPNCNHHIWAPEVEVCPRCNTPFVEDRDGHLIRTVKYTERMPSQVERESERADLLAGVAIISKMIE
jgi:uncharacterized paraquat-inducible protein A